MQNMCRCMQRRHTVHSTIECSCCAPAVPLNQHGVCGGRRQVLRLVPAESAALRVLALDLHLPRRRCTAALGHVLVLGGASRPAPPVSPDCKDQLAPLLPAQRRALIWRRPLTAARHSALVAMGQRKPALVGCWISYNYRRQYSEMPESCSSAFIRSCDAGAAHACRCPLTRRMPWTPLQGYQTFCWRHSSSGAPPGRSLRVDTLPHTPRLRRRRA